MLVLDAQHPLHALSSPSDDCLMLDSSEKHDEHSLFRPIDKPYTVQIIQLTEATAPPPTQPRNLSDFDSSVGCSSSSYTSSSYTESTSPSEEGSEEEEESACSSYCSSDEECISSDGRDGSGNASTSSSTFSDPCESMRMKRIEVWRDNFYASLASSLCDPEHQSLDCTTTSAPSHPPLKRKRHHTDAENDDNFSHCSKRSRCSQASHSSSHLGAEIAALGEIVTAMYPCPACDAPFPTKKSLELHGRDPLASEACSAAVLYALE